ncbi:hypothetical protein PtrSN002B_007462 [Pyrenophora tritici-repentis]|uniref:Uncharacterized protein n=2 Tax=Pyrenophora tritici-repentis TaxID=45151 RepID=A0A2W1GIT1_9PLEO|nr:uncharacterized protein PTRG_06488 [Pyrenophora tritici-repentis Pt-1C-BFP]KAA8613571.1 hypothetical protein PtrV1_12479 [Pyrenophora tritici-repentis]EDU49408.1 conserved hypothetical protein [Pyrenophora tritici-repentis Pt-1C-BFP]KAF7445280.1 hypothetical protein A1F99_102660 [Pyrenophora tritici-repentis]KAI0580727.1 hypothetical protein Alg215_05063 [Pyrenophora tritici-repentis]KAI0623726.1 hypothetical protein TUN199_04274 [Pyrenophora tritici-repentis]
MSPSAVPSPTTQPPHLNRKTTNDNTSKIPAWVKPDLTRLLRVEHAPGSFTSRSVSLVSLPPGALFARITNPTPATVAYSSVQASRDLHIELNSDLVYINHSCAPSLVFDMARWEIRVSDKGQGLKEGDELTFFYPSTEWDMAQPFDCLCKDEVCVGRVGGAKDMDEGVLARYWINAHVEELLEERRGVV